MKPCPRCGSPIGNGNDICLSCHMKEQREIATALQERKEWPACEVRTLTVEERRKARKLLVRFLGEDWKGL